MKMCVVLGLAVLAGACGGEVADPGACPAPSELCGEVCTNTDSDNENCGACGNACAAGEVCSGGVCALTCPDGLVECDGGCIDPMTSRDFCGAGQDCQADPGEACGEGEACVDGVCVSTVACLGDDIPQEDGCLLTTVCGAPAQDAFAGGNCSTNSAEFADWWCQLGGYAGAQSYTELDSGSSSAHHYTGGPEEVLSTCDQVAQADVFGFTPNCTGVRDLICIPLPVSEIVRPVLMRCGTTNRDVSTFIPTGVSLEVVEGCSPDANTQALLVTRDGVGSLDGASLRHYLHQGGIVITEYSGSDEVWSAILPDVAEGPFYGACLDNAPTVVQMSPDDPFWADNPFMSIPYNQTGCGNDVSQFPYLIPLAGWSDTQVAIGYRNIGRGRLWAADFDWQDPELSQTQYTRDLLGYMITHRR